MTHTGLGQSHLSIIRIVGIVLIRWYHQALWVEGRRNGLVHTDCTCSVTQRIFEVWILSYTCTQIRIHVCALQLVAGHLPFAPHSDTGICTLLALSNQATYHGPSPDVYLEVVCMYIVMGACAFHTISASVPFLPLSSVDRYWES